MCLFGQRPWVCYTVAKTPGLKRGRRSAWALEEGGLKMRFLEERAHNPAPL